MRTLTSYGLALAVVASVGVAVAAEKVKSGPQVGDSVGFFNVTKCGGADDGVKVGQTLCYR